MCNSVRPTANGPNCATRVSPPIIGKGERTGHDISLELTADAGDVIGDVQAPTHDVSVRRAAPR